MINKIVLASHNAGKIREFRALFHPLHIEIIPQADLGVSDVEETGLTFIENALIKARHAAKMTSLPAIADDSGLVVPALHGAPGIYSARYAGVGASTSEHIKKLLAALRSLPDDKQQAFFHCVLVFLSHADDPTPLIGNGNWHGTILREPKGLDGFGYDPVFYIPDEKCTAAELPLARKNALSHRGQALQKLLSLLTETI